MTDYVRVTDEVKPRREYTITRRQFDARPGIFTELDKPATTVSGEPIPPKYLTTVNEAADKNKATSQASKTPAAKAPVEKAGPAAKEEEN
ncbi:hypothetical protein [Aeromicrobium sp. UC242_57]|uniref:hypothetical protein n=1 Tax=Aeromicrobium sp. UC242_57 TaxID=3374624 RepID=UPI00379E2837